MEQKPEFTRIDEEPALPSQSVTEAAEPKDDTVSPVPPQPEKNKKKNQGWKPFAIFMGIALVVVIIAAIFGGNSGMTNAYYSEPYSSGVKNVEVIDIDGSIQASGDRYNQEFINQRINAAKYDEDNVGIILRIDSPGGTVYHSDMTYLKLMDYKKTTKRPIYTYCESMCASGGYYIASASDKIYANRNGVVGSIGVISGQFVDATGLLDKLGVKVTTVHAGKNKLMGAYYEAPTEEQIAIMQDMADEVYDQFVGIVAKGRNMSEDQVRALADGRIYSAQQGLKNGLVDEICTSTKFDKAVKKELGDDVVFNHPVYTQSWQESLSKYVSSTSKMLSNRSELAQSMEALEEMTISEPQLLYMDGVDHE